MERVFFHVSEHGDLGYKQLAYMALLSDPLVLWAPAARHLSNVHRNGHTFLTPNTLLKKLILTDGAPPVRIVGRKKWLTDMEWRKSIDYELGRWDPEFDGPIKELALEEEAKNMVPSKRRVIIAGEETGWDDADELLSKPDGNELIAKINNLLKEGRLPPGMQERIPRLVEQQNRTVAQIVLRDVSNHEKAKTISLSSRSMYEAPYLDVLDNLGFLRGSARRTLPDASGYVTSKDVEEAVEMIMAIRPIMTEDAFVSFMKSGHRKQLQELIFMPRNNVPLNESLWRELNAAVDKRPAWKRLFKKELAIDQGFTYSSMLFLFTSMALHTGNPVTGLIPIVGQVVWPTLENYNLVTAPVKGSAKGVKALLKLNGTAWPVMRQVEELGNKLLEPPQSNQHKMGQ